MKDLNIIILGAGLGSRMKSSLPKAMHLLGGAPLISHLIYKSKLLNAKKIISVIGEDMPIMEKFLQDKTGIAYQENRLGSGHAVLCAKDSVDIKDGVILVVYADTPLVSFEVLNSIYNSVLNKESDVCIVGFEKQEHNQYGKLVVEKDRVVKIVEYADSSEIEKKLTLCNSGVMAIRADKIWDLLSKITDNNKKKEYYLTDIVEIAEKENLVCKYILDKEDNVQGANTKSELAVLEGIFQENKRKEFLDSGVQMVDPSTVYFSMDSVIGKDVFIHPNVVIGAGVVIKDHVEIKPFSLLEGVVVNNYCKIGPFARLRPETILDEHVHVGNFVEIKKSHLKNSVKAGHLSYIGDSEIGEKTNIGAGTITCNYDGVNKHKTIIGKNCFIGSNTALVAPLNIEEDVLIGAGSTITKDVPKSSLAVARGQQKIFPKR